MARQAQAPPGPAFSLLVGTSSHGTMINLWNSGKRHEAPAVFHPVPADGLAGDGVAAGRLPRCFRLARRRRRLRCRCRTSRRARSWRCRPRRVKAIGQPGSPRAMGAHLGQLVPPERTPPAGRARLPCWRPASRRPATGSTGRHGAGGRYESLKLVGDFWSCRLVHDLGDALLSVFGEALRQLRRRSGQGSRRDRRPAARLPRRPGRRR